jgi:hypothetical protein
LGRIEVGEEYGGDKEYEENRDPGWRLEVKL